jgi:small subunit ribosomal protein S6
MRPYEVMVIFDPTIEDAALHAVLNRAREVLTSNGADVARVDRWGKRRLAYEIAHKTEGDYVLFDVKGEPAALAEVDRLLGLADEVIRHKVLRVPEHIAGSPRRPPEVVDVAAGPVSRESDERQR